MTRVSAPARDKAGVVRHEEGSGSSLGALRVTVVQSSLFEGREFDHRDTESTEQFNFFFRSLSVVGGHYVALDSASAIRDR